MPSGRGLYGVLTWEVGTARFYRCADEEEARRLCESRAEFPVEFHVMHLTPITAVLSAALSQVRLNKTFIHMAARLLWEHGFRHAYMERAKGRRMPYGVLIDDGPLAGLWYLDLAPIVAGNDGNY